VEFVSSSSTMIIKRANCINCETQLCNSDNAEPDRN